MQYDLETHIILKIKQAKNNTKMKQMKSLISGPKIELLYINKLLSIAKINRFQAGNEGLVDDVVMKARKINSSRLDVFDVVVVGF